MEIHDERTEAKAGQDEETRNPLSSGLPRDVETDTATAAGVIAGAARTVPPPTTITEPQEQLHLRHEPTSDGVIATEGSAMDGIQATDSSHVTAHEEPAKEPSSIASGTSPETAGAGDSHKSQSEDHEMITAFEPNRSESADAHYVSTPSIDSDSSALDDGDSALGGLSMMGSTMSVNSSIYEHVEENGRTYHRYKEGKYFLPNDESERDRLDLQHALFGLTFHNNLYLAPIGRNPQRVLDVATGTGIWAIDFANIHPSAEVIGTDLSAIQPELSVPPNCKFEIDDVEDEWTFNRPFDYIHGRALGTCFSDPGAVIAKCFNGLLPGGYLEMQDAVMPMQYVGEIPVKSSLYQWNQHVVTASIMAKRPWTNVKNYPQYFKDAGFEDLQVRKFYWPSNAWPKGKYFKTLSMYFQQDLMDGLEGLSMKLFTNFLGWTKEQVQDFLVGVRNDLKDRSIHAYVEISVVYGRRPLETMEVRAS